MESIADVKELRRKLDIYWQAPEPDSISGDVPVPIKDMPEWDQPVPKGTQNPYWDLIRNLPTDTWAPWKRKPHPTTMVYTHCGLTRFGSRIELCRIFSWAICTPGDVQWMREQLTRRETGIVEIGAGGGYWAWQMMQNGIDIVAYDPIEAGKDYSWACLKWADVIQDDASAARHHPDRALFISWPEHDKPWAAHALAHYQGESFFYIGDNRCCADDKFFGLLDAEWELAGVSPAHISYWSIDDELYLYRRK